MQCTAPFHTCLTTSTAAAVRVGWIESDPVALKDHSGIPLLLYGMLPLYIQFFFNQMNKIRFLNIIFFSLGVEWGYLHGAPGNCAWIQGTA